MGEDKSTSKDSDNTTKKTSIRYVLTNDIVAIITIISICLIVVGQYILDYTANQNVVYAYILITLAAATWLFGVELIEKYKK